MSVNKYFDLYFFRYNREIDQHKIDSFIKESGKTGLISIVDISDRNSKQQYEYINDIIASQRLQEYKENISGLAHARLIKLRDKIYIGILSARNEGKMMTDLMQVLDKMFCCTTIRPFNFETKGRPDTAEFNYVKTLLCENYSESPSTVKNRSGKYEKETFSIPIDMVNNLLPVFTANKYKLRSIFSVLLSRIMKLYLKNDVIISESITDFGCHTHGPIVFSEKYGAENPYNCIEKQMQIMAENSLCNYDKMVLETGNVLSDNIVFSQYFSFKGKYDRLIDELNDNCIHKVSSLEKYDSPLFIRYIFDKDDVVVEYCYDTGFFNLVTMESIHRSFIDLLEGYLLGKTARTPALELIDPNKRKNNVNSIKMKCIDQLPFFSGLTLSEKLNIADKCKLACALPRQEVIESGSKADSLYFLINGHVEVCYLKDGKYLMPIMLLKSGDPFGIEALLENKESNAEYVINDEKAILIELSGSDAMEFCHKYPDSILNLLEVQSKRLARLQKLWVTIDN